MEEPKNYSKDGEIVVFANAELHTREVIFKALYWYGDKFHTNVGLYNQNTYKIILSPLINTQISEIELDLYLSKLERDLIDFSLRQIINTETTTIRELLTAKAFANGDFEDEPTGEFSDPVGFNPRNF
jgi:His-Xaa-Ser system protein HxsD